MSIDALYTLETPENIEVDFDLAGPGSRFCAIVIDWLMIFLILLTLVLCFMMAAGSLAGAGDAAARWVIALMIVAVFLVTTGYHVGFEMLMRGRTPGKKAMRLRVIREDATHLTLTDSLIRNLLRIIDFAPSLYMVGGLVCLFHPMQKRLGDIAAGTIVIKEAEADYRAHSDKAHEPPPAEPSAARNAELTPAEQRIINGFLARRSELLPEAREALAARLAGPLHAKYGGRNDDPEEYLERLMEGSHHAA